VGAIHVHEFMSLDGAIDAPTWTFDYGFLPQMEKAIGGHRTVPSHPARAHDLRDVRAGVVDADGGRRSRGAVLQRHHQVRRSGTLTDATWRNSKIIGPYDLDAIRSLKDEVDGDIYVSGSGTLVRAMLADGLVDELHLLVYPLTRGSGPRLFPEDAAPGNLSLAACESYENGVVYLAYRPQA
jgi:riboflavin biosynthesis pyrimidine reductase